MFSNTVVLALHMFVGQYVCCLGTTSLPSKGPPCKLNTGYTRKMGPQHRSDSHIVSKNPNQTKQQSEARHSLGGHLHLANDHPDSLFLCLRRHPPAGGTRNEARETRARTWALCAPTTERVEDAAAGSSPLKGDRRGGVGRARSRARSQTLNVLVTAVLPVGGGGGSVARAARARFTSMPTIRFQLSARHKPGLPDFLWRLPKPDWRLSPSLLATSSRAQR